MQLLQLSSAEAATQSAECKLEHTYILLQFFLIFRCLEGSCHIMSLALIQPPDSKGCVTIELLPSSNKGLDILAQATELLGGQVRIKRDSIFKM